MVKVISQETYDAVVKENMEEFGLSLDEARKDAIEQFQSQGVDLSNIITEGAHEGDGPHVVVVALAKLEALLDKQETSDELQTDVINQLKEIESECNIDLARRILAEKNGAYGKILACMKRFDSVAVVKDQCLKSMASVTQDYPDILTQEGIEILTGILEQESQEETITLALKVICHCCKMHEQNREAFMTRHRLATQIRRLLETQPLRNHEEVVVKCCHLIRTLVSDDDVRVEFGRAHDYACMIAEQESGLDHLTTLLTEFESNHQVVKELLPTLSRLAVRNEFCQRIVELGGLTFVTDILLKYSDDKVLVERSLFLIKSLAGNDDVKRDVARMGAISFIVAALDRHKTIPAVAETGCAAVAALCLRTPTNAEAFVDSGVASILREILKIHRLRAAIERQASMAIRNIVSRRKDLVGVILETGVEELLQNALKRTEKAPTNEIHAALRDLGCKVHLQEQWTGKGASVTN